MKYEHKDCLAFLKSLDDESVDLVIVDPPYFEIVKDSWDNQWNSEQEYLDWCEEWTTECFRVLKSGRCFYVWGTTKHDTFLRYKLNVLNEVKGATYQNWIIWHYDWGGRTKKNFARKHEDLLMYSKGKEFLFNADDVLEERAVKTNMGLQRKMNLLKKKIAGHSFDEKDQKSWGTYRFDKLDSSEYGTVLQQLQEKNTKFEKGKIPTDVWKKNNHTTSKEYAGWHPTQKPVALLERIIKANSNEGDVVLDVFNGSGSTTIACNRTGRTFWGCEFDKEYYDKSLVRIEEMKEYDNQ
jgi:DNA modification methylase